MESKKELFYTKSLPLLHETESKKQNKNLVNTIYYHKLIFQIHELIKLLNQNFG